LGPFNVNTPSAKAASRYSFDSSNLYDIK
jgi:hypothetical protein